MIDIDFYESGKDVLLIFTGLGGTTKGYQNKYESIAKQVMNDFHFSVAVVATPLNAWQSLKDILQYAMDFIYEKAQDKDFKVYAMGSSAGANIILSHSYLFHRIKRILAINPVLNVNYHLINQGINSFVGESITVVSGEYDPSSRLVGLISRLGNVQTIILPNVDHQFRGNLQTFIELPKHYLFDKR